MDREGRLCPYCHGPFESTGGNRCWLCGKAVPPDLNRGREPRHGRGAVREVERRLRGADVLSALGMALLLMGVLPLSRGLGFLQLLIYFPIALFLLTRSRESSGLGMAIVKGIGVLIGAVAMLACVAFAFVFLTCRGLGKY